MRVPTQDDVTRLVVLGLAMHAESRYSRFAVNLEKTEAFFRGVIDDPSAIVLVEGDPIHAMFVGYVQPFWWSDELESFDLLLYVLPEHRGKGYAAAKLVSAYAKEAVKRGVMDPKLGETTGLDSERTGRFFERMGFRRLGAVFTFQTVH